MMKQLSFKTFNKYTQFRSKIQITRSCDFDGLEHELIKDNVGYSQQKGKDLTSSHGQNKNYTSIIQEL